MASAPPLSSLRLLIPPLRLLTATMWQVASQQSVKHYGMLEDFVSLVTEAIPQLLTDRQRSLLLLALRAKVTISEVNPQAAHIHRNKIHSIYRAMSDEDVDEWCSALLTLTNKLTDSTADKQLLLQEVFNQSFDSALQSFISDFLSRIEQLFPVPDFKQAAFWLDAAPGGMEDCLLAADREHVKDLLTSQCYRLGRTTATVDHDTEKILLSAWSHPLLTRLTNPDASVSDTEVQSEPLPDVVCPAQLDAELVKVEVTLMTDEQEERGDAPPVVPERPNGSSAVGGDGCDVTPVTVGQGRCKNSPGNFPVQLKDTVDQSDRSCSEITSNALYSISHNSQRVAHKCPQCGKCFIYRSQVIRHLRTNKSCGSALTVIADVNAQNPARDSSFHEEPSRPLQQPRPSRTHTCFQCDATFKGKAELLLHQRSHRARPVYQCGQCDKEFHHLSSLSNHRQTHGDRATFSCGRCGKAFGSAEERDAHRLQHRQPDLTCTVCQQAFGSQAQLLRHLQSHSVEGARPRYSCRFCDQTFSGVTQLRIHQRTHTFRSYQCDQCSKIYSSHAGLHSHRASHSDDSHFLCPQCGKRFKTRDGLEGHLRTHTGERPYRCPYCPKDFTALAGLNVHVRRHTGERPYVCAVCGKGWPSGGDLQKHMRTHTGERPYVCQDCGKAFSISCHLTEHRRIHTGEKPFSCPQCGKCFRRKFDLKKHALSHSSVRPHACVYCPKSYTRKNHLNRHLLTHGPAAGDAATTDEARTGFSLGSDVHPDD
ncbi:zinc finger protein ZFP2-like isoform X2 [Antennarius striatus]|uniref:zinc finger protein ZFP2-like isoform X2 n=1 Tax=Antennarius striatus TaxID=241820 RepID=UPI0035B10D02